MMFSNCELVNEGGFGQIYQCKDENGCLYALKKLTNFDKELIDRFIREVKLLRNLNHPNVIKCIYADLSGYNNNYYYIMPYYKMSLKDIIPTLKGQYHRQKNIIDVILSGVEYIHSEGVFHRDLKPENILYNNDQDIVLIDFGFGIQTNSDSATLTKLYVFGTDKYCSPEQEKDSHDVDNRTDIYSLGKILEDIVTNYGEEKNIDKNLKYIIKKCLSYNKEDRFDSVTELKYTIDIAYDILLGNGESRELEQYVFELEKNSISNNDLTKFAFRLNEIDNFELLESFFSSISSELYSSFELNNEGIAESLVRKWLNYLCSENWTFSYIDSIAKKIEKIFLSSNNCKIRACLLYSLCFIAIKFNRYFAMDVARELIIGLESDISTQNEVTALLKNNRIYLSPKIVEDIDELPSILRRFFKNVA